MAEIPHPEHHASHRLGWLRASVLGANDGLLSMASLLVGITSASQPAEIILLTGLAALAGGALSMGAGEYVSVASQADTEKADLQIEAEALKNNPEGELKELAAIYRERGLSKELAMKVAVELTEHDALDAHARDELGFTDTSRARPVQAAFASMIAFTLGGLLPMLTALLSPVGIANYATAGSSLIGLAILGYLAAMAGGANRLRSVARLLILGVGAMLITGILGHLVGGGAVL